MHSTPCDLYIDLCVFTPPHYGEAAVEDDLL